MFDFNSYYEAKTIGEAIDFLAENDNAKIIAGGTDILIRLRERKAFVGADMIGVTRIPELKKIFIDTDGSIIIGAACTFSEIEGNEIINTHMKSLTKGAGFVGGPQIRNMGTIGGNISNGATSADTAPAMQTFNAIVLIENKNGPREICITEFYNGPGSVKLEKGDLVRGFKIKKEDYEGFEGDYIKFSQRKAMDISTLGCAVLVKESGGKIEDLRVAFGVAAPTPIRATVAEAFAKGIDINDENLAEIGRKCLENTKARDSWRGSKAFREQLVKTLCARAIKSVVNN